MATRSDPAPAAASDNPPSQKQTEAVEVIPSSGNVFADLGVSNPGIHLRFADAHVDGLPMPIASALAKLVSVAIDAGDEHEPQLSTALDGAIAAIMRAVLPVEMTPAILEVLGLPNFRTGPIAHAYRAAGHSIRPKMEEEQAFVLFRFLHFALEHGPGWFAESCIDLDAAVATAKAKKAGEVAP